MATHHHVNGVIMTDTVASRHAIPQHGNKAMTTTTLGRVLMPGQNDLSCRPSLLVSPSLRLTSTRSREPHSVCNLAPGLYIRAVRPPIQGDGLSRLHSGGLSPHSSNLFPLAYTPYCKNFRAFNRGTRTQTLSETGRRAPAWTSIIPCVFGYYHRLPRAARHSTNSLAGLQNTDSFVIQTTCDESITTGGDSPSSQPVCTTNQRWWCARHMI
jgi:hypothetical protein